MFLILAAATAALAAPEAAFGIQFNGGLDLPDCQLSGAAVGLVADVQPVTCKDPTPTEYPPPRRDYIVHFGANARAPMVAGNELFVMLMNGKVSGFRFRTIGIGDQDSVLQTLTEKYGPPAAIDHSQVKNMAGASFDTFNAAWKVRGLSVIFQATKGNLKNGEVTIDTIAGAAKRAADIASVQPKTTPL